MATTDPLKERISLLEMGEAQGKLKPEHKAELEQYRANGRARRPSAAGAGPDMTVETAKSRDDARRALSTLERIKPALSRLEQLQRTEMSGTGLAGLKEYNPFRRANQEYDAAAAQLRMVMRPATRTPGEGSMSDFETRLANQSQPNRWAFDGYNEESLRGLRNFVDTSEAQYRQQLGAPSAPPNTRRSAAKPTTGWKITKK